MNEEWAKQLAEKEILWQDDGDRIIFYDANERPDGLVQVRVHMKDCPKNQYKSTRTATITKAEFNAIKAVQLLNK